MAKSPIPGWGETNRSGAGKPEEIVPADAAPVNATPGKATPGGATSAGDMHDKMLGDFRILRRLGRGGMAEVYLAEQTQLQRNVAVKVLHQDRVADASYLQRFKTEALAAGSLSHPNIVQVLMIGEQDGIQYIAQEYVPGMNLREFLARKGPPELPVALRILRQVASALQAAHSAGVVHRDIKPENIMITRKGDVKVADFGLAQLTTAGERVNLTQDGVTMGTPMYMSPEQVNGSKVDLRTDIYSFGVTCYHLLSGTAPFHGESAISIALQHLNEEPEPLEKIRGDLPPLLCRMVHKMMAKDPEKRYQTALSILKDLKRASGDGEIQEQQPAIEPDAKATKGLPQIEGNVVVRRLTRVWHAPDLSFLRQFLILLVLGILVGGVSAGVGWVTRVPNPLAAPLSNKSLVEKKDKAASQYFYALSLKDSIEAWRAVVSDFPSPEDQLYRNYAKQHLAALLLAKHRFDEAQEIFDEFGQFGESAPQFRAFGLAGQAILLSLRGEYNDSQRVLGRLQSPTKPTGGDSSVNGADSGESHENARRPPVLFDLLDDKMRLAVTETIQRNVEQLNQQMSHEWEEIFKKHEQTDASGGSTTGKESDGAK